MEHHQSSGEGPLNSSGRNLIPRSQVIDVLKNLNIREGLFSEDELRELENGFSVSETSESAGGDDIQSSAPSSTRLGGGSPGDVMNSHFFNGNARVALVRGGASVYGGAGENAAVVGSSIVDMEARVRFEQQRAALQADVANTKQRYHKKLGQLEKQLEQARQEKRDLQHMIESQKNSFKLQLAQQDQKTQEQLREIKDTQYKLQGQVPNFKEKLDSYKREFTAAGSLILSEESYVELKAKPEEHRSLKEFIQVRVYETVERFNRELEGLRRENDELVEQALQWQHKSDRDTRELESIKKLMQDREADARRRIDTAERRAKELEVDLNKINGQYKTLLDRGLTQKEVDSRLRELEVDHATLQSRTRMLEEQLAKANDIRQEVEKRSESLKREVDILNQDKQFLSRENASLEERLKRLEDKLDRTESELLDSKRTAQKYMERVLQTSDDVRGKFEREYAQELQDLKERHQRELESAKNHLVDIYERRGEHLKERNDELERRTLRLEQEVRDKSTTNEELMVELRQLHKTCDEEVGRLKLAVMSKSDELQRVMHLYEDNMTLVKELKLENESLRQKQEVLRTEYYKLEGLQRQGTADIRAELAVCKERLAQYELIEKELDQAIMHVANNDSSLEGGQDAVGNALIATITQAPTAAKRRIQQSLLLANRLQSKQKENEALLQEIKTLKEKLENQESEVKLQKKLLERASQPNAYILADVERAERDLAAANKRIKQQEEDLKRCRKEIESLAIQKRGLQEDLNRLLAKRQEIDNLQTTLQSLVASSLNKKIDVEELKVKLAQGLAGKKSTGGGMLDMSNNSMTTTMPGNNNNTFTRDNNTSAKRLQSQNRSNGRSKSPGLGLSSDDIPERGSAAKGIDSEPAWARALKQRLGK